MAPNLELASRRIFSRQTLLHFAIMSVIAGSVFFTNLGKAKLWDRDEPRNAGCASEMLQRGDWVVPVFNSELRHQKPVLIYWFIMSAYMVLGETELAARIWSALLGMGTVWMTYGLGRRLINPNAGLIAAVGLSTSVMFTVAARAATPDSLLIFFSTLAVLFYVLGTFARQTDENPAKHLKHPGKWFPQSYRYAIGMYAAMAISVLAKGPVGLIVPTAIIGMFLLIQTLPVLPEDYWKRQGRLSKFLISCFRPFSPKHFFKTCWSMRPVTAILLTLLIAGPWYVWVGYRTGGDFPNQFLLGENIGRATNVLESHSGGIWFYPLTLLIGFFPWAVFCFPTALTVDRQLSHGSKYRTAIIFALCWIGVQITLFTLASTKLPSYVTPCYPAIAILTGLTVHIWLSGKSSVAKFWFTLAISGLITSGLLITTGLIYASREFLDGSLWIALIGLIPIAGGSFAVYFAFKDQRQWSAISVGITSFAFSVTFFGFGTLLVDSYRMTSTVLTPVQLAQPQVKVAGFHTLESSWVVYSKRPIFELAHASTPTGQTLNREHFWKTKPRLTPEEFSQFQPDAIYLTTNEYVDELLSRLPTGYHVAEKTPFFLKKGKELILLQPEPLDKTAAETGLPLR